MRVYTILVAISLLWSCEEAQDKTQQEELEEILAMRAELQVMSESEACLDPEDWTFVGLGHKACGGPAEYLAYSVMIDVDAFEDLTQLYTMAQMEYNLRWGIASDCSRTAVPTSVTCEDSKAVLVYGE